ncbi:MAG: FAD binding domain-containing protein [Phycisphaerales bacterium]|nr:FAD binding domain-containing protein [Phycisphaerales bacterium]
MLVQEPNSIPLAGATDVLVHWPAHLDAHAKTYLDLSGLDDLRHISWNQEALTLGARTTYWDVIQDEQCHQEFPLLQHAARQVGAVQIQSRGTWAGNIVNASPAADGVPVLMAYDAVVVLQSTAGTEEVPLNEFYMGYKQMRRRTDQLVVAIRLPRRSYAVQVFEKVGARRAQAITKVGLAMTRSSVGWRVVASAVAPTIRRCPSVERLLEQDAPVCSPDDLAEAFATDTQPIDDIRSTSAYRARVLARVAFHALQSQAPGRS